MFPCEASPVRTHDLLEIDAKQLISADWTLPEWVEEHLLATPFVVVRRGLITSQRIPIGVRGGERNQRWAALCHSTWVKSILTPPEVLTRNVPALRAAVPALRALHFLKDRWLDLDHPWGPGGSVGFELATGRHVVRPESDLDVVIYSEGKITREQARSLHARTMNLSVAIDVRMETLACGFSLTEYAGADSGGILLRTPYGIELGNDPWSYEFRIEDKGRSGGERLNVL
jgi:phosphoribosyl-dephospho-CoA transferase